MSTEKSWAEKIADAGFDFENGSELMKEAMQDYTNKICYTLSPIKPHDMVFILAALKTITNNLVGLDPKADKMSDLLMSMFLPVGVKMSVLSDIPQAEIDRLKNKFFKQSSNMKI